MTYKKPKSDAHRSTRKWQEWIEPRRRQIAAIGLAPEVFLDQAHWNEFLEQGSCDRPPTTGWDFGRLTIAQLRALHRFLEREYSARRPIPALLGFVRVRLDLDPEFDSGS